MSKPLEQDARIVMTLDAGGANFRFCAMQGAKPIVASLVLPACPDNLQDCLLRLVEGFRRIAAVCPAPPAAISFAFPGPADYPRGIIGDLGNLPCFRGGVPLGSILEDTFSIPVFINNDGDLFAYGEAIAGFLPYVNNLLEQAGSPKRFANLLGVTIGAGLGGGIVHNGQLILGDNSSAGEMWLLRDKLRPGMNAEEGASIRAVRRVYAEVAGEPFADAPQPDEIYKIALGQWLGNNVAAIESFRRLGETLGNAIANALTLIDGLVVIGGGLAGAAPLFLPTLAAELNSAYVLPGGKWIRRLGAQAFNLEDPDQLKVFLKGGIQQIEVRDCISLVPRAPRRLTYDSLPRVGVGLSRLGTSEAVAIGAHAFALRELDRGGASKGR